MHAVDIDMGKDSEYNAFFDKANQIEDQITSKKNSYKSIVGAKPDKPTSTPSTPNKKKPK